MSRYEIPRTHTGMTCIVGWDPPLGTFFAQVYRRKRPRRPASLVHWIGTDLHEIPTVEALTVAIAAYVTIPAEIQHQLARDGRAGFHPTVGARLLHALRQHDTEERR